MTTSTIPKFYYIDPITVANNKINFIEPNVSASEITGTLRLGGKSHTNLISEIERAMNEIGQQDYTVTFDRTTRTYNIASTDIFTLLPVTGTNATTSALPLLGFNNDVSGVDNYDGDTAAGSEYTPQFAPQNYKAFANSLSAVSESVNESADGQNIEVVKFGTKQTMQINIKYITEKLLSSSNFLRNDQNALASLRDYLTFAVTKREHEFMLDTDTPATFDTVILESTRASSKGTSFEITELINEGLADYYETGNLTYRKIV